MTTTPPLPRTLPAWIKALDDAPLPAFAAVHERVRLALRDSSKSMRQIAELIQDSPVLALRFIQEANRGIGDGQPAESLEVALSRIGVQRAEALLARIPAMEAADMPRPLRQLVLIDRRRLRPVPALSRRLAGGLGAWRNPRPRSRRGLAGAALARADQRRPPAPRAPARRPAAAPLSRRAAAGPPRAPAGVRHQQPAAAPSSCARRPGAAYRRGGLRAQPEPRGLGRDRSVRRNAPCKVPTKARWRSSSVVTGAAAA